MLSLERDQKGSGGGTSKSRRCEAAVGRLPDGESTLGHAKLEKECPDSQTHCASLKKHVHSLGSRHDFPGAPSFTMLFLQYRDGRRETHRDTPSSGYQVLPRTSTSRDPARVVHAETHSPSSFRHQKIPLTPTVLWGKDSDTNREMNNGLLAWSLQEGRQTISM